MTCPSCQGEMVQVGAFWVCPQCAPKAEEPPKQNVFISYGRVDAMAFAERLADDLKKAGHTAFFDVDSIRKGAHWEVVIETGIRKSKVLAAVMTAHSVSADSVCRDEVVFALNEGVDVLPIKLVKDPQVRPTLLLSRRNWIDFSEDYDRGFAALLAYLKGDETAARQPDLATIVGLKPIDFGPEIARLLTDFSGRDWINEAIDKWLRDDARRTMVIVAEMGVGKSAIAAWLTTRSDVAGVHFCTQRNSQTREPQEFVASMVAQLQSIPGYAEAILAKTPEIKRPTAADGFRELIVDVTRSLPTPPHPYLIIVDSLDESLEQQGETVLDVLVQQAMDLPTWLRVIATSRPEEPILARIRLMNVFELLADRQENRADVRAFLDFRLKSKELAERVGSHAANLAKRLEELSDGNFLYAKMALDAIADGSLKPTDVNHLAPGLTQFFFETFRRRFSDMNAYRQEYAPLMRTLAAARGPLGFLLLAKVNRIDEETTRYGLGRLKSYLRVQGRGEEAVFAIFHRSLKDWITDMDEAGDYWCSPAAGDKALADVGWGVYLDGKLINDEYFWRYLADHLVGIKDWERLAVLLTDLTVLDAIDDLQRSHEWMRHWRILMDYVQPGPAYKEALERVREQGATPATIARWAERIGSILRNLGLYTDALEFAEMAVRVHQSGAISSDRDLALASSLRNLAEAWRLLKNFPEARSCYEQALEIWLQRKGAKSAEVATIYHDFAEFYRDQGDYESAIESNNKSMEIREKLVPLDLHALADCVNDTGVLLWESGRGEDALTYYERSLEIFRKEYPSGQHYDIASVMGNIGNYYSNKGDYERALTWHEPAVKMALEFRVAHAPPCMTMRKELVNCYAALDRFDDAIPLQRQSVRAAEILGQTIPVIVELSRLRELLTLAGRDDEGRTVETELFRRYRDGIDELGGGSVSDLTFFRQLALDCVQSGRYSQAEEVLDFLVERNFELSSTHCHLARVCLLTDRVHEALTHTDDALLTIDDAPIYVYPRVLYLQIIVDLLNPESDRGARSALIGRLKSLLRRTHATNLWTMEPVLDHIANQIPDLDLAFLTALLDALCGRPGPDLDAFDAWKEAPENP